MAYFTRNKNLDRRPPDDIKDEPKKVNPIAEKPSVQQPNQSNLFKENKMKITDQRKATTIIKKNETQFENINYNLDVFAQNILESEGKFNKFTIFVADICDKFTCSISKNVYRAVCKVGYGGSSVVWLVIDTKKKEFKIAKVFKYGQFMSNFEETILNQTSNQPNILRFYEDFHINSWEGKGHVAIYEPLGKDLYTLMKEASKGLSISIVKKVAKHVLLALKTIHDLKVIHTDIKLQNIAPCVSQFSLRQELEKIVKSGNSLSSLRMVCQKNTEFDENLIRKVLEAELDKLPKQDIQELTQLLFKLIDFGNAMKEGTESPTGTYRFRPPEYFYGAPLLQSHDIWSLGITIVVLLTNKNFLEFGKSKKIDELTALRNMFGKFSRQHFKSFKDPGGYKTKYSTRFYTCSMAKKQLKKVLQNKFDRLQMGENDRNGLINFLLQMLNTIPTKRKSAAELLLHPWLIDCEVQREPDINAAFVTPVVTVDTSSPSNSNDETSEILLDDLSINEQMRYENSEVDAYNYDADSDETEYGTDSDEDETEDDSNKTIIEFGSGESYVEGDASFDPHVDSSDDEEFNIAEWSNV